MEHSTEFTFVRLTAERLERTAALCDACVGKNLYPRDDLADILHRPDHHFWLLLTAEGEIAGYLYFYSADLAHAAELSRLPRERISAALGKSGAVIGVLRSIGVAEAYRGRGLSGVLLDYYLRQLEQSVHANAAFGVFWKPNGVVPMGRTLEKAGFRYLEDAHMVWYEVENLVCPYCVGRCTCDAAVYYRPIEEGEP